MRNFPVGIVGLMLLARALSTIAADSSSPRIGDAPPALQLGAIIQGPRLEEASWEKLRGKVVIVEFWNTACVPCVAANPHLNQLVAEFTNQPVVFLSICDDNPDYLKNFLRNKPISAWLAIDAPLKPTFSAFHVLGIPHTVIVDRSGKIAAITHPDLLTPEHIQEILDGKPSTLPPPESISPEQTPTVPLIEIPPREIEVSITGPFPKPNGAYAARGWHSTIFHADKAPIDSILTEFFHISEQLLPKTKLPEGLYSVRASAPSNQMAELQKRFIQSARDKWRITIEPTTRRATVYITTVATTNAPGLKQVQERAGGGEKPGGFYLGGLPIKSVVNSLEHVLDKPVIDETGLQGLWAAELNWEMTPEELTTETRPAPAKVIKAAHDQLGLDLQSAEREIPTLIIRKLTE